MVATVRSVGGCSSATPARAATRLRRRPARTATALDSVRGTSEIFGEARLPARGSLRNPRCARRPSLAVLTGLASCSRSPDTTHRDCVLVPVSRRAARRGEKRRRPRRGRRRLRRRASLARRHAPAPRADRRAPIRHALAARSPPLGGPPRRSVVAPTPAPAAHRAPPAGTAGAASRRSSTCLSSFEDLAGVRSSLRSR